MTGTTETNLNIPTGIQNTVWQFFLFVCLCTSETQTERGRERKRGREQEYIHPYKNVFVLHVYMEQQHTQPVLTLEQESAMLPKRPIRIKGSLFILVIHVNLYVCWKYLYNMGMANPCLCETAGHCAKLNDRPGLNRKTYRDQGHRLILCTDESESKRER